MFLLNQLVPVLVWIVLVYMTYLTLVPLLGFFKVYERPKRRMPKNRFAIVIPAHNEAAVILQLLQSIDQLMYPKALYDTFVVADNCQDDTAEVARQGNAQVFERRNMVQLGKGYALEYAFERIVPRGQYDAVVIVDADNLINTECLKRFNEHLLDGKKIIQARKDAKNPNDNFLTSLKTLFVWSTNRFWFVPKHNLGCSSVLLGSGMCISTDIIKELGWNAHCLTEDFEFTARVMSHGHKVHWADETLIYEEEPQSLTQVWHQHVRWARGQNYVLAHYGPKLFWEGAVNANLLQVESALQLFQSVFPILGVTVGALSYFFSSSLLFVPLLSKLPFWFWLAGSFFQYLLPLLAFALDRTTGAKPLRYLWLYPLFSVSWILIDFYALVTFMSESWHVTEHSRPVTLAEVTGGSQGGR